MGRLSAPAIGFSLILSLTKHAAAVEEIFDKINTNQIGGNPYVLTPEEIERLETSPNPAAQFYLGMVYAEGDTPNTGRDQCKAAELIYSAAVKGYPYAHIYMAHAVLKGFGVNRDVSSAKAFTAVGKMLLEKANASSDANVRVPYLFERETNMAGRASECLIYLNKTWPNVQIVPHVPEIEISTPCITENRESNIIPEIASSSANPELEKLLERYRNSILAEYWCEPPRSGFITYGQAENSVKERNNILAD